MSKEDGAEILLVDGHEVRVTHPDKPYFTKQAKLSKIDIVRYYLSIAPGALAGIRDRPIVLKRFVNGAEAARLAGDLVAQSQLANEIGVVHYRRGDYEMAREAFADCLRTCEAAGNAFDTPTALHNVAYCDLELGRFEAADEAFGRALPALAAATKVWRDLFPSPEEVYTQGLRFMKQKWAQFGA